VLRALLNKQQRGIIIRALTKEVVMDELAFEKWRSIGSVPDGSMLLFSADLQIDGIPDEMRFGLLDLDLRDCGPREPDGRMTCTIKCPGKTYAMIMALISARGTIRIELPDPGWFSQWRVAVSAVDHPCVYDADHMTGNLTFAVTNTAPDDCSVMRPVFGNLASR
jgi:hypothetical protein